MIKRAHLYTITSDDVDEVDVDNNESQEITVNNTKDDDNVVDNVDELSNYPDVIIKASTNSKALKCKCCPGKLILNDQDLNKHLESKTHKKRVSIYRSDEKKIEMAKHKFTKRIRQMEVDSDNSSE